MSERRVALSIIPGLLLFGVAACGHPQKGVVDKYFGAVNSKDTQTLSSFAVVNLDKKVDAWTITKSHPESTTAAPLPELAKKEKDIEAALAQNKKAYNAYFVDHPNEVDQVQDLHRKRAPIPPKLAPVAAEWEKFTQKEKELKRALAEAKMAVEKELRSVRMSVGEVENVETLLGDQVSRQIDLDLTMGGRSQKYVMTLRKYELRPGSGPRVVSRWIVQNLTPAG